MSDDKKCPSPKKFPSRGELAYLNLLKIKMDADKTYTATKLNAELDAQWEAVAKMAGLEKKEKK